ncbi:Hpt domain-containing protein [Ruminococcaceae bacterium YRB3002]|nr:Hpt domain-containing protein [Ruminococcaceae bacterium YRB3002]
MATIEELKAYGANTEAALSRLMGNETFYLALVPRIFEDKNFEVLSSAIAEGDLDKAFDAAHSLKGVLGNLELTPILQPMIEITELLRHRENVDYSPYLEEIFRQKEALEKIFEG